jgi:hypothetical protein
MSIREIRSLLHAYCQELGEQEMAVTQMKRAQGFVGFETVDDIQELVATIQELSEILKDDKLSQVSIGQFNHIWHRLSKRIPALKE